MDEITKEIRKNPKCNINIGNEATPGCFLWMDDVVLMHTDPQMIQNMLDTTYRIAQRYRIKFGTEKSKVLHIGPPTPLRNKFTLVLVYTQMGSLWSIVLRCDDHTGIFTCDGCARDPYFYVPAETQRYVIKLSCSRKVLAASGD